MKALPIFVLAFVNSVSLHAQSDHYWYRGQKIFLDKLSTKEFILFDDTIVNAAALKESLGLPQIEVLKFDKINVSETLVPYSTVVLNKKNWAIIQPGNITDLRLSEKQNIVYESPFYYTSDGIEVGVSHLFYVKLRKADDLQKLAKLASSYNVTLVGRNKFMPLWYTLACSKASGTNALEMASTFYETSFFAASEPDLMIDNLMTCVDDAHFGDQWNLNNTGQHDGTPGIDINFCQARTITTGDESIIIAVLDQGIELNHPDMTNMHGLSYDTESGTSPSQVLGDHGTACAGIIGATPNSIGVSGIAPDCPLMSISNSMILSPNGTQGRSDGINFAWENGASVISNSWHDNPSQMLDDAIENALTLGRNGLGCVVVFASGNNNGSVSYPANSYDDIIAVGAMSPCGERKNPGSCDGETWWGSNFGAQLDIVAPGVLIPTTDRQGTLGYNNATGVAGNYHLTFNGTSSACPHVAAVAGLILSIYPNLTQTEVADFIESTAQKVGGDPYFVTPGRPNGTWNPRTGYGLLDGHQALMCLDGTDISGTLGQDQTIDDCVVTFNNVTIQNSTDITVNIIVSFEATGTLNVPVGSTLIVQP